MREVTTKDIGLKVAKVQGYRRPIGTVSKLVLEGDRLADCVYLGPCPNIAAGKVYHCVLDLKALTVLIWQEVWVEE